MNGHGAQTVIRYADWTITPETAREAPGTIFEFRCTTCGEEGPADEDFERARGWTFLHVGRNPTHRGYAEVVHRFWRMTLMR